MLATDVDLYCKCGKRIAWRVRARLGSNRQPAEMLRMGRQELWCIGPMQEASALEDVSASGLLLPECVRHLQLSLWIADDRGKQQLAHMMS